ncbi:hypothetical protein NW754_000158 [Fusarium falciforme]|nr:hypothetical protein NW754_000158 [Fusarium falciforme]
MIVLLIYILYFVHEIKSRSDDEVTITTPHTLDIESGQGMTGEPPFRRPPLHQGSQILPPRTIRFADEDDAASTTHKANNATEMEMVELESDVNFAAHRGRSSGGTWNGTTRPSPYQLVDGSCRHSRSLSLSSNRGYRSQDSSVSGEGRHLTAFQLLRDNRANMDHFLHDQPQQHGDRMAAVVMLIVTSVLMSMCAEFLVGAIDDVTHEGGLSEPLIGLIILPIVGNIAEYVTVVTVVARGKLDLAIAVSVGSAIQISMELEPEDERLEGGVDVCLLRDIWAIAVTSDVICASRLGTASIASNKIPRATTTVKDQVTVIKRIVRNVNVIVVPGF